MKIKLDCESCGAPISHILPDYDDDYGHIYQCDYCSTKYYIRDDQLQKYYEEPEIEQPIQQSSFIIENNRPFDIVKIAVAFLIGATCLPIALTQINQIKQTSSVGWNTAVVSLFPIIIIFSIIVGTIKYISEYI